MPSYTGLTPNSENPVVLHRRRRTDADEYEVPGTYPWWLTAIYKLGPVTVIALFLIWFVTHNISSQIEAQGVMLREHIDDMRQEQLSVHFYLRAICLNTSQRDIDRANCLSAPPSAAERPSSRPPQVQP